MYGGEGGLLGDNDALALQNMSRSDIADIAKRFKSSKEATDVTDEAGRKWANFVAQFEENEGRFMQVLKERLVAMEPQLEKLSDAFTKVTAQLLDALLKNIPAILDYLHRFADALSGKRPMSDLFSSKEDLGVMVQRALDAEKRGDLDQRDAIAQKIAREYPEQVRAMYSGGDRADIELLDRLGVPRPSAGALSPQSFGEGSRKYGKSPVHNPLGMRPPDSWLPSGTKNTFSRQFDTDDEGFQAAASQLLRYYQRDHLDTIEGIVSKWAPQDDGNDTDQYIKDVARATGYASNQHLNLSDPSVLASIMKAMMDKEGTRHAPYTRDQIQVIITKPPGGDVNVTTKGASVQGAPS